MLDKPPEINDVFDLVKDISHLWYDLGRELGVSLDDRDTLRRDMSLSEKGRLNSVLANWIRNETREVKWKVILEALEALERKDLVKKVIKYLETPQPYRKYISMDDFSPGKYNK